MLVSMFVLTATASAGPTAHVGKELTKGVIEGAKDEMQGSNLAAGAKEVSNAVIQGVEGHGREIDRGAHDIGKSMAQGVLQEVRVQLGSDGSGPLAASVAGTGQAIGQQVVRGIGEELASWVDRECSGANRIECADALMQRFSYDFSHAAAAGAAAGAPQLSIWTPVLFVGAGFAGGLLVSAIAAMLLGQRQIKRTLAARA